MQKNATPNAAQAEVLKRHGLTPGLWTVVRELRYTLIIRSKVNGDFWKIEK